MPSPSHKSLQALVGKIHNKIFGIVALAFLNAFSYDIKVRWEAGLHAFVGISCTSVHVCKASVQCRGCT